MYRGSGRVCLEQRVIRGLRGGCVGRRSRSQGTADFMSLRFTVRMCLLWWDGLVFLNTIFNTISRGCCIDVIWMCILRRREAVRGSAIRSMSRLNEGARKKVHKSVGYIHTSGGLLQPCGGDLACAIMGKVQKSLLYQYQEDGDAVI